MLSDTVRWAADAAVRQLPDGRYTVGIRPHHIGPAANGRGATALEARC